ncbi:lytic murein transglycosylase [Rhodovulum tesquicola]|uniref:lytic murein transglycosylase n=1 Tax=Rhodovulum tesquicola TaxID=540254 RepID=UPI002096E2CC|nr:lytic murein transglycosylase [Rhodovulum tesquicola]MCO8143885.1 lytic murein transglycosylase [Rhodovulum tesquicola]
MRITRRSLTAWLGISALAACSGGVGSPPPASRATARPVANPAYDAWLAGFRQRAAMQGIAPATLDRALRTAGFLPDVVERDRSQTEFTRTLEDYLAIAASDERIAKGRAQLARRQAVLRAIEARHGVPPEVVTAIWGLESMYGERRGDIPVVASTSTLAFDGRRGAFFEQQLIAALRILQRGDVTPERMTGSWAGAMGHTQFIPTSYLAYAVDFDGDGRADIWSDDPADALASAAAYLGRSGWQAGRPWGMEVQLPPGFDAARAGRGNRREAGAWSAMGVRDMNGRPLPDHGPTAILVPAGPGGPAFALFRNFDVILRYNNAQNYAIGVGHLSDRLLGRPPIRGRFPPDATGLTLDDRKELQRRLTAAGLDTGGADGVIGARTEAAIRGYQQRAGLPVTGQPSAELLRRLR